MAETPDLAKVPNFDALRDWADKLEQWCEAMLKQAERMAVEQSEMRDGWDMHDRLVDDIRDVERGIMDFDELTRKLPSIHMEGAP